MTVRTAFRAASILTIPAVLMIAVSGCLNYPFLLGQSGAVAGVTASGGSVIFGSGDAFTDVLIQARTFVGGTAVTTETYRPNDLTRTALGIDFNADGKVDPVVVYGGATGVFQILLSQGATGSVDYISLTLDSGLDIQGLSDVAVGDIDNDGALDLVGAASGAIWYFHHPTGQPTTALNAWGNQVDDDTLRERIETSVTDANDPNQNVLAIIAQVLGTAINLADYIVTSENVFTDVEIADFDQDGNHDIVATRSFRIILDPRPTADVEGILIVDGDILVFLNPGGATDGRNWTKISIGRHERQLRLDRDGATSLVVFDMDGDNDLDLVSTARDDNNVQVAWFENPGAPLNPTDEWKQWRVGSLRDAWGLDVADLTGDGRPDVIATGGSQQQMMLFEQPMTGPKRAFDWDTFVIVTFETYEPRDVKALDIDGDGDLELVVGGTNGALRYFEAPNNPRRTWTGAIMKTFSSGGVVSRFGYGDLDGDGDLDLVATINAVNDVNESETVWIRNDRAALSLFP